MDAYQTFVRYEGWEFPQDRFIEYGLEDEGWGSLFGFGHAVSKFEQVEIKMEFWKDPKGNRYMKPPSRFGIWWPREVTWR